MNFKSFQKQTLDEIISGWYIQGNEIISSTDLTKSVKYEKFERIGDYLRINTPFGEEVYVLKNNNGIYRVEKEIDGYFLFNNGKQYILVKDGKISSEFDKIDLKVENEIAYGEIKRDGKFAFMKFDGKEEKLSDWYNYIWSWRVENGIVYGKVKRDGKWALMKFDGKERLSDWYDNIGIWRVENGIVCGRVKRNGKMALMKFDGKEEKLLPGWYDYIRSWRVENGIVYGEIEREDGEYAFMKFDGKEETFSDWYDNIENLKVENGVIYIKLNKNDYWHEVEFKKNSDKYY